MPYTKSEGTLGSARPGPRLGPQVGRYAHPGSALASLWPTPPELDLTRTVEASGRCSQ